MNTTVVITSRAITDGILFAVGVLGITYAAYVVLVLVFAFTVLMIVVMVAVACGWCKLPPTKEEEQNNKRWKKPRASE